MWLILDATKMNNQQKILLTYKIEISLYDASFTKKSSSKIYQVAYVTYSEFIFLKMTP